MAYRAKWRRAVAFLFCAIAGLAGVSALTQESAPRTGGVAILAQIEGVIGPASARFLETAIATAGERDADLLVLQLNTPGGLVTSMREMVTDILEAPVPVIGYVAPQGGHAASAGTYILYATHLAAMAPGTNIGAATPVQIGGPPSLPELPGEEPAEEPPADEAAPEGSTPQPDAAPDAAAPQDGTDAGEGTDSAGDRAEPAPPPPGDASSAKAQNDAVAYIRSLAELRGRNAEWAEKAVRGAGAITPQEALDLGVIELVAEDLADLLAQADGRTVMLGDGAVTLATEGLVVEQVEPSFMTRVLGVIANPNVAFIFMLVGVYGLIFELAQPGSIGPGVIGVISLIIGLYALNQLPLNYAGAALVVLGLIFMVVEAVTPSFGVFGLGGLVAFLIGAAMLVDTDVPEFQLSWLVIAGTAATSGGVLIIALGLLWRAVRAPVVTGVQQLIGAAAVIQDWADGRGHVMVGGDRWNALSAEALAAGQTAYVARVEGLTLQLSATPPKKTS